MNKTKIEWVKNPDGSQGYTWNPLTGCLNHINGMCKGGGFPCYAYKLAHGRLKSIYLANTNIPEYIRRPTSSTWQGMEQGFQNVQDALNEPFFPRFWEDRLEELITRNEYLDGDLPRPTKRRGIFVCDMSDLFGIGIPEEWTRRVLDTIDWNKGYDRFYLLTKQPQNLIKFSPFPENCWVGVTATNDEQYFHAVEHLCIIKAKVKFISFEPLLAPIFHGIHMSIDWVIIGAQTKPYKPPEISWVEEIVRAADQAGVKVFLKDNLKPLWKDDLFYALFIHSPFRFELRQDMPI